MKDAIAYVGLDAHKRDIYVAMPVGHARVPVIWQLANEPRSDGWSASSSARREAPAVLL